MYQVCEKIGIIVRAEIRATPRLTAVMVWRREEARWVRCTARMPKASEPTLDAYGLAKRRAACASVNLSSYFVFHNVTRLLLLMLL